ncbi:MAG: GntR family transcriptional regulator [Gordonia sp. (in: high G+C Gram-positive bacteria)]|uniref:GntR family transcriptional regulator n=1 Tax=Gordonia sp. (in: high G+C Gram-positive bacteria) TaxID=84139 RepID=UPI0039E70D37
MTGATASEALLADSVYRDLTERIFVGSLGPGAPLSVPAIAAELEVSRSPVRDAVQRLVAGGLAVHVPHAGAKVAKIDDHDIEDVFSVRRTLDGLAARGATERASTEDVTALFGLLVEQEERLQGPPDALTEARLDLEFHTAVRDLAGNSVLSDVLHQLDIRAHLYNSGLWSDRRARELAVAEHQRIVDAIESGDANAAEQAATAHVSAILVRMRRLRHP